MWFVAWVLFYFANGFGLFLNDVHFDVFVYVALFYEKCVKLWLFRILKCIFVCLSFFAFLVLLTNKNYFKIVKFVFCYFFMLHMLTAAAEIGLGLTNYV